MKSKHQPPSSTLYTCIAMVQDIFRDSTIGQAINYISNGRIFPYTEQRPDFEVPPHFLLPSSQRPSTIVSPDSDATTLCGDLEKSTGTSTSGVQLTRESTLAVDIDAEKQKQIDAALSSDPYIVGWYGDDDQDNPRFALLPTRSKSLSQFYFQKLVSREARICRAQHQLLDLQRVHRLSHLYTSYSWSDG